jgi:hypothetical protein
MNEPKRRGRPPKVKPEPKVEGADCVDCGQAAGHYDDCPKGMGVEPPKECSVAQAYAERVWNGQSPEVHREERLRRVKLALDGQGLSMEGVEL